MTAPSFRFWFVVPIFGLAIALSADAQDTARPRVAADGGVVLVTLRPQATSTGLRVCINDLAGLSGGDSTIREAIGLLDVADAPEQGMALWIPKEQVFYRIRIAGIDPQQFRLEGTKTIHVSRSSIHQLEDEIITAAKKFVAKSLPAEAQDISVQLARPISGVPARLPTAEKPRLEPRFDTPTVPLGHVQVSVAMIVGGQVMATIPVHLVVQLRQNVAVTTRRLERGEPLNDKNVFFMPFTVERLEDYVTTPQSLVGQRTKRFVSAGQPLTKSDIEPSPSELPILVKQQRLVKMVAQVGGLEIGTVGEALQDGRAGELIRVRNIDSQLVVVGKVVDRSTVQVAY
jgi:flagella basal body P-ring formation protein FlgA